MRSNSSNRPLSVHDVRPLNRAAMLNDLRRHGPSTRRMLAKRLELSHSAVSNVAAELLAEGVLLDRAVNEEEVRVGRPSSMLEIDASSRLVLGVQVKVGAVGLALCDLLGRVVLRSDVEVAPSSDPAPTLGAITSMSQVLLRGAGLTPILGIGVAVPGPVDTAGRVSVVALNLGWRDVQFADVLEGQLGLPVVLDHNVRAMALAEAYVGRWRTVESLAFVHVGSGVGAGLILNGRPYRGGTHGVTEIGHLPILAPGPPCVCGNTGCLETVASEPALAEAVIAAATPGSPLAAALGRGEPPIVALLAAARSDDADAGVIVSEFIHRLAAGLVSIVNLLNPQVVVVGGLLAEARDLMLEPLRQAIEDGVFPVLRSSVRLEPTSFGVDSGVVGAASVALERFFYDPRSRLRQTVA